MTEKYQPKTMHHPQYRKSVPQAIESVDASSGRPFKDYVGTPELFPPVTVETADQEALYRSKGYFMPSESPPPPPEWSEYPVMLVHPDHVDAVPDETVPIKTDQGIVFNKIPGRPEKFPPRAANNPTEEKALEQNGYKRAGVADPDAVRTAHAAPFDPSAVTQEFPKWVNGTLIDPGAASRNGVQEYPKWVGDKIVNSAAEEAKLLGLKPKVVEKCVICGDGIGDDDPAGEGPMGKYHLAHMVPSKVEKHSGEVFVSEEVNAALEKLSPSPVPDADAPFGRKKDGTPKKRPGRGAKQAE